MMMMTITDINSYLQSRKISCHAPFFNDLKLWSVTDEEEIARRTTNGTEKYGTTTGPRS